MSALKEMIRHTRKLQSLLEDRNTSTRRDQIIKESNELLDKRAELIPKLQSPSSDEEKRLTQELMHMNKETQEKMNLFLQELKEDMQTSKMQRKSNLSYTNPYNQVQVADGMFVDRKK